MSNVRLLDIVIHQQSPNVLHPNNLKLGYQPKKKKKAIQYILIGDLFGS